MSLLQSIKDSQLIARKARDADTSKSLTTLIGEITSFAKGDGNREATDKDTIKFLTKFVNSAKENRGYASDFNNPVGFYAADAEVKLFESFLPAAKPQMDVESLTLVVRNLVMKRITTEGATPKMGVVMADLKAAFDGEYDPKAASGIVKAMLA